LIAEKKVLVMIVISIGNGGGDAQGSERGLEYDTMSGRYAEFVEQEVLPLVETQANVKLTKDPDARATMGGSSGGSCALIMAWYHPELYHRVLTYSGTYVNQQWPPNADTPHGAWEFHEHLIPNNPAKPIRIWLEVGDRDLFNPNAMRDDMHDWVLANERMAEVLATKGYHYQFVFARNAAHVASGVKLQTLPEALEWLWQDYQWTCRPKFYNDETWFSGFLPMDDRVGRSSLGVRSHEHDGDHRRGGFLHQRHAHLRGTRLARASHRRTAAQLADGAGYIRRPEHQHHRALGVSGHRTLGCGPQHARIHRGDAGLAAARSAGGYGQFAGRFAGRLFQCATVGKFHVQSGRFAAHE
jgi:hypothetical protein